MGEVTDFIKQVMGEQRMLQAYIRAIVRDSHLIEDILQDVVVVAIKQQEQYLKGTDLGAWLRAIARRTALAALRQVGRQGALVSSETLDALERNFETPRSEVWEAEREALVECLKTLPPNSYALLAYKYADERPIQQIAADTGRSIDSVKSLLKRLRIALADCITLRLKRSAGAQP